MHPLLLLEKYRAIHYLLPHLVKLKKPTILLIRIRGRATHTQSFSFYNSKKNIAHHLGLIVACYYSRRKLALIADVLPQSIQLESNAEIPV